MREAPTKHREAIADHRWFDWVMAVLSAWLIGGAFVDGWAHTHGKVDTTFYWHVAFYTGFLAVAGALVGALVHQRARRGTWLQALPPGYNLALLGAAIFGCGGVGDMLWHTFFGIERMSRRYSAPRTSCWAVAPGSWSGAIPRRLQRLTPAEGAGTSTCHGCSPSPGCCPQARF